MYPRLSDLLPDLFGIPAPFPIYAYGVMVAVAIGVGVWLGGRELDRLYDAEKLGSIRVEKENGVGTREASPAVLAPFLGVVAAIAGVAGAKLFHVLENLDQFAANPAGIVFSTAGLTFYGGLIAAGLAIAWIVKRNGLSVPRFADATAPGLMLAYGIGRIGCYLAGDGDWGVCSSLADKPGWIPAFLWSETFPRSILDPQNATQLDALQAENCPAWADGVFPTMLYETAMAVAIAGVLWALRTHPYAGGWLFSLYLVFNGAERFLIEQIRVNNTALVFGVPITQAEVLALALIAAGLIGLRLTWTRSSRG